MTTTTTTTAIKAEAEAVKALVEAGATPRQAEVVAIVYGGIPAADVTTRPTEAPTNKAIGEALTLDAGTVSNALTEGLRAIGRADLVSTPKAKGKAPKAQGAEGMAEALLTTAVEAYREAGAPVTKAEAEAKAITTTKGKAEAIEAKAQALKARIEAMTAEAEALTTEEGKAAFIEAEAKARTARVEALRATVTPEAVEALRADVANAIVAAKAIGYAGEALTEAEAITKA